MATILTRSEKAALTRARNKLANGDSKLTELEQRVWTKTDGAKTDQPKRVARRVVAGDQPTIIRRPAPMGANLVPQAPVLDIPAPTRTMKGIAPIKRNVQSMPAVTASQNPQLAKKASKLEKALETERKRADKLADKLAAYSAETLSRVDIIARHAQGRDVCKALLAEPDAQQNPIRAFALTQLLAWHDHTCDVGGIALHSHDNNRGKGRLSVLGGTSPKPALVLCASDAMSHPADSTSANDSFLLAVYCDRVRQADGSYHYRNEPELYSLAELTALRPENIGPYFSETTAVDAATWDPIAYFVSTLQGEAPPEG